MPLTQIDIQSAPTFDGQSVTDATDWAAQSMSEDGTGVVSGMNVTALATPSMGASVHAGSYVISGLLYSYAGGSVAAAAASVSDRRDIITINSSTPTFVAGTQCGTAGWTRNSSGLPPVKPAIPSASLLLSEAYIEGSGASATTSIVAGNLVDKTTLVTAGNYAGGTLGASVSVGATSLTKIFDTASLGIGTWFITAQCLFLNSTSATGNATGAIIQIAEDGATCTFSGPTSAEQERPALASTYVTVQLSTIAVVTGAGTIKISAYCAIASSVYIKDEDSLGNVTGYTAVRIA